MRNEPLCPSGYPLRNEPLCPSGIWGLPQGMNPSVPQDLGSPTWPRWTLDSASSLRLCVLLKCSEIKPFYPDKSSVALVSSSGLKAILLLPLVFDLRFKSARPPWFGADLGGRCGKRQSKGWEGSKGSGSSSQTTGESCKGRKPRAEPSFQPPCPPFCLLASLTPFYLPLHPSSALLPLSPPFPLFLTLVLLSLPSLLSPSPPSPAALPTASR